MPLCDDRILKQCHAFRIHVRTYVDSTIKYVRDRGLDHAVEKEKNLLPLINIKNFVKSEVSKSVPISVIAQNREALKIPIRPIDFVRKYPSIFEEFLPGGIGIQPHVRLTSEVLELDAEEQLAYQGVNYKQAAADRLLKLLMLSRIHKIPLSIIDQLKWDLGLPQDYLQSIVPDFPDYFQVLGCQKLASRSGDTGMLELVCWNNDLATSVLEKMAMRVAASSKGTDAITFPMQFSSGFEMDKKFKKWVDEWQKLPYISPYENASNLTSKSDESDKWTVAVLHELLHLFVAKKIEKENILYLGEYFGLRPRFKRALLQHPGIFYLSSKLGTYTVVLKEGYKRGSLIENNPLVSVRNQYVHLMNMVKEGSKPTSKLDGSSQQQRKEQKKESDDDNREKNENEFLDSSDEEAEDGNNYNVDVDRNENGHKSRVGFQENAVGNRLRTARRMDSTSKRPFKDAKRERSSEIVGDAKGERSNERARGAKRERSSESVRDTKRERSYERNARDSRREISNDETARDSRRERPSEITRNYKRERSSESMRDNKRGRSYERNARDSRREISNENARDTKRERPSESASNYKRERSNESPKGTKRERSARDTKREISSKSSQKITKA